MNETYQICRRCQFRVAPKTKVCRTCGSSAFVPCSTVAEPPAQPVEAPQSKEATIGHCKRLPLVDDRLLGKISHGPSADPHSPLKTRQISTLRGKFAECDDPKFVHWPEALIRIGNQLFSR